MEDYTLTGTYTLPSLGKVYDRKVNPEIKLRSMTVIEEQKRLNTSDRPYKNLAIVLDDCLIDKPEISSYDLCLSDFQFLLHRLRVVTYGSNYRLVNKCPYCGYENEDEVNLLDIPVIQYTDDLKKYLDITLPVSKQNVKLRMQTPRMLDDISVETKKLLQKKRSSSSKESAFLLSIEACIESIDGKKLDRIQLEDYLRDMQMADVNYILAAINRMNDSFGLDTELECHCDMCDSDYDSSFRVTPEFFRPSIEFDF